MFTVQFYATASGNQVVLDFLRSLPEAGQKIVGTDLKTVQFGFPLGMPLCRSLGGGLWEVRSTVPGLGEVRLIFFKQAGADVLQVTNGFLKKTRATPNSEIERARIRMREFSG